MRRDSNDATRHRGDLNLNILHTVDHHGPGWGCSDHSLTLARGAHNTNDTNHTQRGIDEERLHVRQTKGRGFETRLQLGGDLAVFTFTACPGWEACRAYGDELVGYSLAPRRRSTSSTSTDGVAGRSKVSGRCAATGDDRYDKVADLLTTAVRRPACSSTCTCTCSPLGSGLRTRDETHGRDMHKSGVTACNAA